MNNLVSIIVPVYNAEGVIFRCLDSILNQTYTNLEIIIINDGSTDRSADIIHEYEKLDDRIIILYQTNAGPSAARNNGIDVAKGKYLQFVDADDFLEDDMTENMIDAMQDSQLVICGYEVCFTGNKVHRKSIIPPLIGKYDKANFLKHFSALYQDIIIPSIWNKLYVREIVFINKIRFKKDISMGEDLLFNLDYLKQCDFIRLIPRSLYRYVISHDTSLSRAFNPAYIETQEMLYLKTKHFLTTENSDTKTNVNLLASIYAVSIVNGINNLFHQDSHLTKREQKAIIKETLNKKSVVDVLPFFNGNKQLSLVRRMIQANAVNQMFLYFKFKNFIYTKLPFLFLIIKRFNQKD